MRFASRPSSGGVLALGIVLLGAGVVKT